MKAAFDAGYDQYRKQRIAGLMQHGRMDVKQATKRFEQVEDAALQGSLRRLHGLA